MVDRDYKITLGLARRPGAAKRSLCIFIGIFLSISLLHAGERETAITRSALNEVRAIAKIEKSLERFGKSTLSQSAVVLDLGLDAQPVLLAYLKDTRQDWKVRFWAADILAYVGDASAAGPLLKAAKRPKENKLVRNRARKAVQEIRKRLSASRPPSRPSQ